MTTDNKFQELSFRGIESDVDFQTLAEINRSSHEADHDDSVLSPDQVKEALNNMEGLDLKRHILIAFLGNEGIGYSRLGWYSSTPSNRLYYQVSFLRKEARVMGIWKTLIRENDRRLREIAATHGDIEEKYLQAWASDNQIDWITALKEADYQLVRQFNNMLHNLGNIPQIPLPQGFTLRPVRAEDMRKVWEAQKAMNMGMFEMVMEDWAEEKYPDWLKDSSHTPHLWQIAWDGEELAGMVLCRIDEEDNKKQSRKRGITEHIYVNPRYRNRGLASALISKSLMVLKDQGMTEVELGVDAENGSNAFKLYENMGYKTFYIDLWFRKPMRESH